MNITWFGLGTMGYPMAAHLLRAGHTVTVWNRSREKAERWIQAQATAAQAGTARMAETRAAAAANAEVLITCVGRDADLVEVLSGPDGAFQALPSGALVIDHSTVSADVTRRLAEAGAALGLAFLDAPVSGGQQGAENGQLSIFCGGTEDAYARAQPVLSVYAKLMAHLGPVGSGQQAKMVNQVCVAGVIQGLAEGIHLAQQAGLPVADVMALVAQGAGGSWQLSHRHGSMLADHYDHGFAVDWMVKDLDIVLSESDRLAIDLPVTTLIRSFYGQLQARGGGRWDTSSLLRLLQSPSSPTEGS